MGILILLNYYICYKKLIFTCLTEEALPHCDKIYEIACFRRACQKIPNTKVNSVHFELCLC